MNELTSEKYFPCPHCGHDALEIYTDTLIEMGDGTLIKVEDLPALMCDHCENLTIKDENGQIIKDTVAKKMADILAKRDTLDLANILQLSKDV